MKLYLLLALCVLGLVVNPTVARNDKRIVGGSKVISGQFPDITWQVGLLVQSSSLCGGAILNDEYILTAAHCVKDMSSDIVVNPASVDVRTGIELMPPENLRGSQIWVHPTYSSANSGNSAILVDLAIIKLNRKIVLSPQITAIQLPRTQTTTPPPGNYIVSGYGTTVSNSGGSSGEVEELRWVDVPYVPYGTCDATAPFTVPITSICAGGVAGKDSCQGDSGSSLVINAGTQQSPDWVLAGIVSSGTRVNNPLCAVASEYGIYVDVKRNLAWIDSIIMAEVPPRPDMSTSNFLTASLGFAGVIVCLASFLL